MEVFIILGTGIIILTIMGITDIMDLIIMIMLTEEEILEDIHIMHYHQQDMLQEILQEVTEALPLGVLDVQLLIEQQEIPLWEPEIHLPELTEIPLLDLLDELKQIQLEGLLAKQDLLVKIELQQDLQDRQQQEALQVIKAIRLLDHLVHQEVVLLQEAVRLQEVAQDQAEEDNSLIKNINKLTIKV